MGQLTHAIWQHAQSHHRTDDASWWGQLMETAVSQLHDHDAVLLLSGWLGRWSVVNRRVADHFCELRLKRFLFWRCTLSGVFAACVNLCWISDIMFIISDVRYMSSSVRLSICRLSVTFMHPTQAIEIFGNISTPFGTLAICWHPGKILRRSS